MDQRVKKALLKDNSIGNQLNLAFYRGNEHQKLKIKLEIDITPPQGSGFDYTYLDFPLDFEVCHQDLSSNFSLKIHTLLCRPYVKGRDWYAFNWYVKQNVQPNYIHLQAALDQYGPWEGQIHTIDKAWLIHALREKAAAINWPRAIEDVTRFINPAEQPSLQLWSERFFRNKIERLG
jgi:hypothetical protein